MPAWCNFKTFHRVAHSTASTQQKYWRIITEIRIEFDYREGKQRRVCFCASNLCTDSPICMCVLCVCIMFSACVSADSEIDGMKELDAVSSKQYTCCLALSFCCIVALWRIKQVLGQQVRKLDY